MKAIYRGHEIECTREPNMIGESMLFWSIFRQSDGYECDSGFSSSSESPGQFIELLKRRVDAELGEADPWMESEHNS